MQVQFWGAARTVTGSMHLLEVNGRKLLAWAAHLQPRGRVRKVFLVHGEEPGATSLAEGLSELGVSEVEVPDRGQVFTL